MPLNLCLPDMVYLPEVARLDTCLQYDSAEFAKFAKDWEFKHVTS